MAPTTKMTKKDATVIPRTYKTAGRGRKPAASIVNQSKPGAANTKMAQSDRYDFDKHLGPKSDKAHQDLRAEMQARKAEKRYGKKYGGK